MRIIFMGTPEFAIPSLKTLLEHGYDQAAQVRDIFQQNGFEEIFSAKDIAGIDRVSSGVKPRQA